jgi:putative transposase
MEPSKAVKEYKDELIKTQVQNELVGKVTVEKEWLVKKLKSKSALWCFHFVVIQVLI